MKASKTETVVVTLELSESDAERLRAIVQNPIGCCYDEEDEGERAWRLEMFRCINGALQ
jgi:hypothetical protein